MVYLAGPIDFVERDEALGWRASAASQLSYFGFNTYNPAAAFRIGSYDEETAFCVDNVNRTALRSCNFVLASVTKENRTIGTWREIEHAVFGGKPVILVAPHLVDKPIFSVYDLIVVKELNIGVQRIAELYRRSHHQFPGESPRPSDGTPSADRLELFLTSMNPPPTPDEIIKWFKDDAERAADGAQAATHP